MARWTSRWGRRTTALSALVMVLALAAGCGGADPASGAALTRFSDIDQLIAAVSAQQRVDQTARFTLRGELIGTQNARLRFVGEGALRITDADVELRFTQIVTQPGADPQETGFVVLPGAVYLRMPVAPQDSTDRPWVRIAPDDPTPEAQPLIAQADSVTERADLTRTLARFAGATVVTEAEDDVIEGDPAVRYTIVTDLAQAAEQSTDPQLRAQLEEQVRTGLATITSTLWVDGAHRPLRSASRQQLPGIGTLALTSSYRDWGQGAAIEAPPEDQVR